MSLPKKHSEGLPAGAVAAVICAAGASARMGGVKKEYCPLPAAVAVGNGGAGCSVLGAAVSAFAAVPAVETIVIVVPPGDEAGETAARKVLPPERLADDARPRILFASGGNTRRASVKNALSLLAALNPAYVLIHDGARPWVSPALIERVIAAAKKHGAAVPLLPLTETPKETDFPLAAAFAPQGAGETVKTIFVKRHLKRANTGAAQTPQGFAFAEILAAHERAAVELLPSGGNADNVCADCAEYTDDAEIWAAFCGPVAVVPGAAENRKITFPEDLR